MNICGLLLGLTTRKGSCNYSFIFPQFTFTMIDFIISVTPLLFYLLIVLCLLIHSVQLMSIMNHYGYATRPLVEYNLDLYTERASFLGCLGHMSERRRLAITLDPASSEPTRFKNKRVQASEDISSVSRESETEVAPVAPPSSTKPSTVKSANLHPLSLQALRQTQEARIAARAAKRKKEADSDDDYKPPIKLEKTKSKRGSSKRSFPRSKASSTKPNTSAFGIITDDGGKCPKYLYGSKQEASDSDTSLKGKEDDKESHSDSLTDS